MTEQQRQLPIPRRDSGVATPADLNLNLNLVRPSLTETRRVAIGKKEEKVRTTDKGKKWRAPMKLDYFLITHLEKDERGDFIVDRKFHEEFGDKPREIPIQLLFDRVMLNAHVYLGLYTGVRAACSGNGQVATRILSNGEEKKVDCPCEYLTAKDPKDRRCKHHLRFQFKLPGMGIGEMAVFRSTGRTTIDKITGALAYLQIEIARMFRIPREMAPLSNIPLKLRFHKKTIVDRSGNQRTIPVVHVVYDGTHEELDNIVRQNIQAYTDTQKYLEQLDLEKRQLKALPASEPEDIRREIANEFHPDEVQHPRDLSPAQKEEKRKKDLAEDEVIKKSAKMAIESSELPDGMKESLLEGGSEEEDFPPEDDPFKEEEPKPKKKKDEGGSFL